MSRLEKPFAGFCFQTVIFNLMHSRSVVQLCKFWVAAEARSEGSGWLEAELKPLYWYNQLSV